jgi:hypothetical protein
MVAYKNPMDLNRTINAQIMRRVREMSVDIVPAWMAELDDDDVSFIKNFILCSGSLKDIAILYGVTYPTVRLRLDKLIQKIQINEDRNSDPFISLIKKLALNEKIDFDTAKIIITSYKKSRKG